MGRNLRMSFKTFSAFSFIELLILRFPPRIMRPGVAVLNMCFSFAEHVLNIAARRPNVWM